MIKAVAADSTAEDKLNMLLWPVFTSFSCASVENDKKKKRKKKKTNAR